MQWSIQQIQPGQLGDYARIPMRIRVESQFSVKMGENGFELLAESVDEPYEKDYDSYEAGSPARWPDSFRVEAWGLFLARANGRIVGAAAVLTDEPNLGCQPDEALLWDIRIEEEFRGHGLGSEIFNRSVEWAQAHGAKRMLIETQNVNVGACKFYTRVGCSLLGANPTAYEGTEVANEVELIWVKDLG